MPDFLLTDHDGNQFKLTGPEGVSEADAAEVARTVAASRMKQAAAPGERQEGMLTRGGEAIGTVPVRLAEGAINTARDLYEEQMRTPAGQMEQDPQQFLRALGTVGGLGSPQFAMAGRGALEGGLGAAGGGMRRQTGRSPAPPTVSRELDYQLKWEGIEQDLQEGRITPEEAQRRQQLFERNYSQYLREEETRRGGTELGAFGGRQRSFSSPRQIRSHLDELNEAVRAGRMTPEQLGQARVRMGLPAESPVNRISAATTPGIGTRPVSERTLGEMRSAGPTEDQMREMLRNHLGFVPAGDLTAWARNYGLIPRSAPRSIAEEPQTEEAWGRAWQTRAAAARPPAAPQSSSPLGHYGQEFYNEHIAPHFPDQNAFVQSYFNGAYNSRFNVDMTREGHLEMDGPLVLDGKKFGEVARIIDPDGRTAHHDYLRVDDTQRGGGFVKQMTASQVDLYRKMGIERVGLYANVDVGGYAWAKYGWLPEPREWQTTARGLGTRLRRLAPDLPPAIGNEIQRYLENPDPHAIWALSDIRTPWQHPDWDPKINTVGKAMLSGQSWGGTLLLNNQRQMARFNDYVGQGK